MLFRVLLPALVAALTIGCQGLPSAHHTWIAPSQAKSVSRFVEVHGAVALAGSQPIPQSGMTLAEAIKNAGGVAQSNTDAAGSAGTLVCLRRQSQAAYFALPLVADGPVGAIQLAAGDRINVGPWTATGLFRGL